MILLAEAAAPIANLSLVATLPFWPLLGAIVIGLCLATGRGRDSCHLAVVGGVAISALLSIAMLFQYQPAHSSEAPPEAGVLHAQPEAAVPHADSPQSVQISGVTHVLYRWISFGDGRFIEFSYLIDPLTIVMLLVVTIVSTMVILYAVGYMKDHHGHRERGYERFFAFLGLFVFSMCMLVLAGNFVLLYLGWELVGLCSYLLIGFYYAKPEAAAAAKKAFIVNRIGDLGFALGIFALYMFLNPHVPHGENPLDYRVAFAAVNQLAPWQVTTVCLLLFCGAMGKSAQLPLYTWLPDAMEGPTPVSALIHAATMVTAGVYMVARCGPLFAQSPFALDFVAVVGVAGAIFAATMAMAQYDMKRILAYSTMSQLAYMFVGLGCGVPDSAIFHLYTHAFFKALLFLCAGSVMHAMGGVIDLRHFSGLRGVLPNTYRLMLVGCLALAGFPLLAGFWSKDELVHAAFERSPVLGVLLLVTAAMTAYYTFRMFFLCFHGPLRLPAEAGEHADDVHDSPTVMIAPKTVLAIGAVLAGYVGVTLAAAPGEAFLGFLKPHGAFHHYLADSSILKTAEHHGGGVWLMYVSAAVAIGGILVARARYGAAPTEDPDAAALGGVWRLWQAKYYVDEIYDRVFVQPLRRVGEMFFATDRNGIDGLLYFFAGVPKALGFTLRFFQQGAMQGYALGMSLGIGLLLVAWNWMGT
ncbi:MAG: NADH-quinone oxidoreductase subunit L [Phycisphaerae bacterium]